MPDTCLRAAQQHTQSVVGAMTSIQTKCSSAVQSWFYNTFYAWGLIVAKFPKSVITGSFLLATICSLRLILAPANAIKTELRFERLFAPQDSQGIADFERYTESFGFGSRRNVVYVTTQTQGGNVLTSSVLAEVQRFDNIVRNELYMYQYKYEDGWTANQNISFDDICLRGTPPGSSPCLNQQDPLELFKWANGTYSFGYSDTQILDIVNSGVGIDSTLFPPASNRKVPVDAIFGGIERDASGRITSAAALILTFTTLDGEEDDAIQTRSASWEEQLNYLCGEDWVGSGDPELSRGAAYPDKSVVWASQVINVYPNTDGAISREFANSVSGDLMAVQIGIMLICFYATFILFRPRTPKSSRGALSFAGVISCGMAIAVAYSLGALINPLNTVVNVLPFILIGIGVDDMFVLINALESVPVDLPVPERIAKAMAHAGVSVTITSITDIMAFLLGSSSKLPALSAFCVYAAFGILADFALQISFFAGWMALDAYREKKERSDCFCCPCAPKPPVGEEAGCCTWYPQLQDLNVKYYVPMLRKPVFKVLVLTSFFTFTGICAWQASSLQQDFDRRWFVESDSKLQDAFSISDTYFTNTGSDGVFLNIVTPPSTSFDYRQISAQAQLVDLATKVGESRWVRQGSVQPWYTPLKAWAYDCIAMHDIAGSNSTSATCVGYACRIDGKLVFPHCTTKKYLRDGDGELIFDSMGQPTSTGADQKKLVLADGTTAPDGTPIAQTFLPPASFYAYLDQFLFDSQAGSRFSSMFNWTVPNVGNLTLAQIEVGVVNAQFRAQAVYLDTADEQIESMRDMRKVVESVGMGDEAYPYTFVYIFYEQFAIIQSEAFTNLALALVAVFIITTVIIGSLHASAMVIICIVMVDIDILGLMYMWGLTIDSVTIINLVLAVGLAVDYSAHVAHAFVVAKGTRQERAEKAIAEVGTAVVHGALSTFLAVVILSSSQSYVFTVFFKQFFGICIFGATHGLLFLPVLLSYIGPAPIDMGPLDIKNNTEDASKQTNSTTTMEEGSTAKPTNTAWG